MDIYRKTIIVSEYGKGCKYTFFNAVSVTVFNGNKYVHRADLGYDIKYLMKKRKPFGFRSFLSDYFSFKSEYKSWVPSIGMWEEKFSVWKISFYVYSVFNNGKTIRKTTFFRKSKNRNRVNGPSFDSSKMESFSY